MNRLYLLSVLAFFVSCKKEVPITPVSKPAISVSVEKNDTQPVKIDPNEIKKIKSKLLSSFYQSNNNTTVWLSSKQRKIALDALTNSYEEGLNPEDYDAVKLNQFEKNRNSLSDAEWVQYDLLLTNGLKNYIFHLTHGRLNPNKLYEDWDLKENKINIVKSLIVLNKSDSLADKIEGIKPNHLVYKKLKEALAIISTLPKYNFKNIVIKRKIAPKNSNPVLIGIKQRLIYWGDLKYKDSLTQIYDAETLIAVKEFQDRHGLSADGIIGQGTIAALNFTKIQRKQQIIANLERWKWFPRSMGKEYIIINIPDFKLRLVKNQDTIRTHRIIVGTIERKTPILSSKLGYAVFNPTWTVPPTILEKDIIPETVKDRNHLAIKNITVFDVKGDTISPNEWQVDDALNYRYVQSPGTYNSLGMVKLIFPNRFSVYLHDTNHRDFFEKNYRSLSSGCVRVENPLELTEYLLDNPTKWNINAITETLKGGKTTNVNINKKVLVQLLYWTAWSDKNKLIFRDDIYNLDADLYAKLYHY